MPPRSKTALWITKDELWPMRFENGAWRYNWNNLIDFRTLDARSQTMNGITIMPVQINRFSDRVQLAMLVQNRTNETIVFGQVNEILGTFILANRPWSRRKPNGYSTRCAPSRLPSWKPRAFTTLPGYDRDPQVEYYQRQAVVRFPASVNDFIC